MTLGRGQDFACCVIGQVLLPWRSGSRYREIGRRRGGHRRLAYRMAWSARESVGSLLGEGSSHGHDLPW